MLQLAKVNLAQKTMHAEDYTSECILINTHQSNF